LPGTAGTNWGSSQYPHCPDPPLNLWEGRAVGKGGQEGRIKGEMGGWGEDRRKGREGRK